MIEDKDISIVVQGPIIRQSSYDISQNVTQFICQRLRKIFPKSEIILSTWQGENVEGILYDKLVLSEDPGATWFNYEDQKLLNNCNRLITSTFAGIKAADRKFVLKLRSDVLLISKKFLKYFFQFPSYNQEYKFVQERIICFSLNTLYGHKTALFTMNRPFHISDWAYFGFKTDLLNLYDIPLVEEPEFSQWFLHRCKPFLDIEPGRLWKMPPEQYVTHSFLKKFISINFEHTADDSNDNMELSSKLLTNNFLILDQTQFFLISLKYLYFAFSSTHGNERYIFHKDWLKQYVNLMHLTAIEKLKLQCVIGLRSIIVPVNKLLRLLNQKNQRICRLCAFFIKKLKFKDNYD